MKTEALKQENNINLEPFYEALEDEPKLLEEAFEILLEMVSTDPKVAKKIALLIKEEYSGLYKQIATLCKPEQGQANTSSCCSGH